MSIPFYTPPAIYSLRLAPSWLLFAMAAGAVNAGALLACERFVSHVTGSATRVGVDVGQWALMGDYALVLAAFIAGAMTSVVAIGARFQRGRRPLYGVPLLGVACLVATVAIGGLHGWFGTFGGEPEQVGDFWLLCILGFAMGLQNATVATGTGMAVRTTHMTGPATDLGVHLATAMVSTGDDRRSALQGASLRATKLVAFITGGILMLPAAGAWGFGAFLLPAAIVVAATAISFISFPTYTLLLRGIR